MGRCSDARDRLLDTAAQLVHERGYTAVSVSDICKEAGLKKGSFYHFFRSKHALVLAALDRVGERQDAHMESVLGSGRSVRERLKDMIVGLYRGHRLAQQAARTSHGCPLGNITQEMAHRDPEMRLKLEQMFATTQRRLSRMLAQADAREELSVREPDRAAEAIIAYLQGTILLAKATDDPEVFLRLASGMIALAQADLPTADAPPLEAAPLETVVGPCQVAADVT